MLNEKKSKRGTVIALLCALALLALVVLLENTMKPTGMLFTVLKKGAVYALVAVSMNLLNGFTGLFSLGQAGFMLLGAYTYAILTIPTADREAVYYLYNGSAVNFSLPELFAGGAVGLVLGVLLALFLGGPFLVRLLGESPLSPGRLACFVLLAALLTALAGLLFVLMVLSAFWLKAKLHRMDGDRWEDYFQSVSTLQQLLRRIGRLWVPVQHTFHLLLKRYCKLYRSCCGFSSKKPQFSSIFHGFLRFSQKQDGVLWGIPPCCSFFRLPAYSCAPHLLQNSASSETGAPHCGQVLRAGWAGCSGAASSASSMEAS